MLLYVALGGIKQYQFWYIMANIILRYYYVHGTPSLKLIFSIEKIESLI